MGVLSDIGRSNALGDATGVLYKNFMGNLAMRDAAGTAGVKNATDLVQLEQHQRAQEIATRRADEELAMRKAAAEREAAKSRPVFLDNYAKAKWGKVPGLPEFMIGKLSPFAEEGPAGPMIPLDVLREVNGKLLTDKEFLAESNRVISTGTKERMSEYYDEIGKLGQKLKEEAAQAGPAFDPTKSATYAQLMELNRKHSKLSELGGALHEEYKRLTGEKVGEGFTLSPGAKRFDAQGNPIAENPKTADDDRPYKIGQWIDFIKDGKGGKAQVTGYDEKGLPTTGEFQPKEAFDSLSSPEANFINPRLENWIEAQSTTPSKAAINQKRSDLYMELMREQAKATAANIILGGVEGGGVIVGSNKGPLNPREVKTPGQLIPKTLLPIPQGLQNDLQGLAQIKTDADTVERLLDKKYVGPIAGRTGNFANSMGLTTDQRRAELYASLQGMYDVLGKDRSGANFTVYEEARLKKELPTANDPIPVLEAKFRVFKRRMDANVKVLRGTSKVYMGAEDTINSIWPESAGGKAAPAPAKGKPGKKRMVYNPSTGRLE